MDSTSWPDLAEYTQMLSAYDATFRDAARGTRVSDVLSLDPNSTTGEDQNVYDVAKQVDVERTLYERILRYMPPSFASAYADAADDRQDCTLRPTYRYGSESWPHLRHANS